jgi:hypothetical protein
VLGRLVPAIASAQKPVSAPAFKAEKCYGIAKAGNRCTRRRRTCDRSRMAARTPVRDRDLVLNVLAESRPPDTTPVADLTNALCARHADISLFPYDSPRAESRYDMKKTARLEPSPRRHRRLERPES